MLQRLKDLGLNQSRQMCFFFKIEAQYLAKIINLKNFRGDPINVDAIKKKYLKMLVICESYLVINNQLKIFPGLQYLYTIY